jgi:hypothetical protein
MGIFLRLTIRLVVFLFYFLLTPIYYREFFLGRVGVFIFLPYQSFFNESIYARILEKVFMVVKSKDGKKCFKVNFNELTQIN